MPKPKNQFILENCKGKIVDIGSNNGSVFPDSMRSNITSVDIDLYDIPNFVRADAHKLPFKNNSFDTAVLAEILEHVNNPIKVIKEAYRVSDRLIITVPNDSKWDSGRRPYDTIEKLEERTGRDRKNLAEFSNPDALDFYTDDDYRHLWHVRWYTEKSIKEDLRRAGIENYTIEYLEECGVHWFGILINKEIVK